MTGEDFGAKGKQDKKKEKKNETPKAAEEKPPSAAASSKEAEELKAAITKQGDKVRELKTGGAPKVRTY